MASAGLLGNKRWQEIKDGEPEKANSVEFKPIKLKIGDPDWIRTNGLLLRRQLLYPAELRGLISC